MWSYTNKKHEKSTISNNSHTCVTFFQACLKATLTFPYVDWAEILGILVSTVVVTRFLRRRFHWDGRHTQSSRSVQCESSAVSSYLPKLLSVNVKIPILKTWNGTSVLPSAGVAKKLNQAQLLPQSNSASSDQSNTCKCSFLVDYFVVWILYFIYFIFTSRL